MNDDVTKKSNEALADEALDKVAGGMAGGGIITVSDIPRRKFQCPHCTASWEGWNQPLLCPGCGGFGPFTVS